MSNVPSDVRKPIYDDLHQRQMLADEQMSRHSAVTILGLLFKYFKPASMCDVGCGLGTWLAVAHELEVHDIFGIEGPWLNRSLLCVPQESVSVVDLEQPFALGRRFDLLICLEVAEHLSSAAAKGFIGSLTAHADVVLFSAAIPFQGGHHHINEQFLDYWERLFLENDFVPVDFIRKEIWTNSSVHWWLRQNIVVFTKTRHARDGGPFAALCESNGPLSVVHPAIYHSRMQMAQKQLQEFQQMIRLLSNGSVFSVQKEEGGKLTIKKME